MKTNEISLDIVHRPPGSMLVTPMHLAGLLLAWLVGVTLQLQQTQLNPRVLPLEWLAVFGAVLFALGCWPRQVRSLWVRRILQWLALGLWGFVWTQTLALDRLSQTLPTQLEGEDIEVIGVVTQLPQRSATGLRFSFRVEQARHGGEQIEIPSKILLSWYVSGHFEGSSSRSERPRAMPPIQAGERWQLTVRLRQPHGNMNPHGFDYELYLFEQGIGATGYVRDKPSGQRLEVAAGHLLERWRQQVRNAIEAQISDPRVAGLLSALSVGDQSAIDMADWEIFRDTGVAHLVSISGLHVTMFAWMAGMGIGALWRRCGTAALWMPAPNVGRWCGAFCALGYALFSGWGIPAQRTVWMLLTICLLQSLGRRWPWSLVLLTAAVVVTTMDPWALLQAGFWLSFMAVGLLLTSGRSVEKTADDGLAGSPLMRALKKLLHTVGDGVRTQAIATIGLAPLSLIFFQQVSLVGFFANLVAIPLVTMLITPLALLGALISPLWMLGSVVTQWLLACLDWFSTWPQSTWSAPAAPIWAQLLGLSAAVLMLAPWPWRLRALGLPLLLPLLWPAQNRPPTGEFDLVAVDVGQGTALIVRTRNHTLLYDTGPQYSPETDAGQRVLIPLLQARGELTLDKVLISHRDNDHSGGALSLMKRIKIQNLSSSIEPLHPIQLQAQWRSIPSHRCVAGERWNWDGVEFEILHPASEDYERELKSNWMSCVLKVTASEHSALLTGDIEKRQERDLVDALPAEQLQSTVLIAPHHGSKTSSTPEFLSAVQASVVLVQAGYRNRFKHPALPVVERYAEYQMQMLTTVQCGAWTWRSNEPPAGEQSHRCQREKYLRYWHHRPVEAQVQQD
jgi:competence protein ComEC